MATATLPQLKAPFRWEGEHIAADLPGARALFTTRRGGVSSGPFASLNLGLLTDDDGANVNENRARVAAATGCPRERFLYGKQVHGATVRRATEPPGPDRPRADEDGQATALRHHPALVFVADCTPVILAAEGAIATLHVGWRPAAAGIVHEGIEALREVGGTGPITALIGPGARGCCYEVGEEVHAHFAGYDARRGTEPRPARRSSGSSSRTPRSTTSGSARCAGSACSSRTAATAASRAARPGSRGDV